MLKKFLSTLFIGITIASHSAIAMFKEKEQELTIYQIIAFHQNQPLKRDHEFTVDNRKFIITKIAGNQDLFKAQSKDLPIKGQYFSLRKEWLFTYIPKDINPNEKTNSFSFSVKQIS